MLTVAGIINAFGITIFLSPVKLYDSGISGTSMLLDQITPEYLSLSVFLLILNIPLFLFGLKQQGKLFTGYASIRMRHIVHSIDPAAYITISEIADVFSVNNND